MLRIQKVFRFFSNFIYRVKRVGKKQKLNFIAVYSVVPEILLIANRAAKHQSHRIFSPFMKRFLFPLIASITYR